MAPPPAPRGLSLDHAGLFVPDMDAAGAALEAMGFTLTPFTPQQTAAAEPGRPPAPAGTANRCVMLAGGYIEVLTALSDATPVARQLRAALARYTGLHLIAFGTADAAAEHRRLAEAGFAPLPLVPLERPVVTEGGGEGVARFAVVRVPPGAMAEGRIQFVQQRTPELVWQLRFLGHRNRAAALVDVLLCVEDPGEAAARFARFTGRPAAPVGTRHWRLATVRGHLTFMDPATLAEALPGVHARMLPWIAALALASGDLAATRDALAAGGVAYRDASPGIVRVDSPPAALGATFLFSALDAPSLWG